MTSSAAFAIRQMRIVNDADGLIFPRGNCVTITRREIFTSWADFRWASGVSHAGGEKKMPYTQAYSAYIYTYIFIRICAYAYICV